MMEIRKIEKSDLVLFPRLQRPGLKPKHVAFESFKAELKHIEGHGSYWLLYQQAKPHLVVHVQLPKSEAEFDNILGWCLGQNKWCDYIEGNLSFICVIAGYNAEELSPKYPDFFKERVYALYDSVYWWYKYGKALLKQQFQPKEAAHKALPHSALESSRREQSTEKSGAR
jgi:hypothetical protein